MAFEFEYKFVPLSGAWPQAMTVKRFSSKRFATSYVKTLKKLAYEIEKLDPRGPVLIEADFRSQDIRFDGQIRADARKPAFPGVIINFTSNRRGTLRFACDSCVVWQHNVHALALALERLRLVDKDGVTQNGQQYKGWKALPAPDHAGIVTIDQAAKYVAFHCRSRAQLTSEQILVSFENARTAYHAAAQRLHPDVYKDADQADLWRRLMAAWALIEQMHQSKGRA